MRKRKKGYGIGRTLLQMAMTCMVLLCVFTVNSKVGEVLAPTVSAVPTAAGKVDVPQQVRQLPIIMYHSVLKDSARWGKYVVSPQTLARDLDFLQAGGYETVTVAQLADFVNGRGTLPAKPVMVTFDDGYYNNYLYAAPLLRERGMQAVISVIGEETERFTREKQENPYWAYLSAEKLHEAAEEDVFEVQNHSYALHTFDRRKGCLRVRGEDTGVYRQMFTEDTAKAQQLLIDAGLPAPQCYTYPYGAYSKETEQILRETGFICTMNCEERMNTITQGSDCLFGLGRYNRPSGESTEHFMTRVLGG